MKAVKVDKGAKGFKVMFADEKQEKEKQRQGKLDALANKKAKGKLTLEDLDTKLDIIIELLTEKPPK
jgi:hypothetical protein